MYSKTEAKSERVLELYREGNNIMQIIKEVGPASKKTIKNILFSHGIDYTEELERRNKKKLEEVVKLYEEGKSQVYIEQTLNLTRKTIRELLKSQDIHYKSKSEQWTIRHGNTINTAAFDILTPEALYWLGMLYTDGHVAKGEGYGINLSLHSDDVGHLEKFKKFLGSNKSIRRPKDINIAIFTFGCERIHNRLRELGFRNDKSYTAIPHELLRNSVDFWRGCMDGDGCLWACSGTKRDRVVIHLCGTYDTCFYFTEFLKQMGMSSVALPHKASGTSLYQISYESLKAKQVADILYKDSTIHLDRKYNKYLEFFS